MDASPEQNMPRPDLSLNAFDIISSASRAAQHTARFDSKGVNNNRKSNEHPQPESVHVQLTHDEAAQLAKLRALPEHVKVGPECRTYVDSLSD